MTTLISHPVRTVKNAIEAVRAFAPLASLPLWAVAIWMGVLCLVLSFGQGLTLTTEVLFGISFFAGVLGMLADRLRRDR